MDNRHMRHRPDRDVAIGAEYGIAQEKGEEKIGEPSAEAKYSRKSRSGYREIIRSAVCSLQTPSTSRPEFPVTRREMNWDEGA
jgi:hypothetical protein